MTRTHLQITNRLALVFTLLALGATTARAQNKMTTASGFGVGYTDIGPTVGIGNVGSASASFGGRLEHGFKALPDMGNGTLGLEASFDYYSWSNQFFSYKYIPLGVTANYHFKLDEPKFDPFVGLGLGYRMITCDYAGSGINGCASSAVYFIGRVGARYFFQPKVAAYADVGAGAATLNLGVTFKLN